MNDTPSKLFALLCLLGAVWTGVYWLWEPRGPRTTIDPRKPDPGLTVDDAGSAKAPPLPPIDIRLDPRSKSAIDDAAKGAEAAKPKPAEPATPPRGPRVVPPEFTEYVVRRGDTFESIARRQFGDVSFSSAILRANPLTSDDLLKPGMTILIPKDPGNIQGKLVQPKPEDSIIDPPKPAEPAAATGGKMYRIQSDDTLWGISKKFYGKGAMYKLIADANKDKIPNPDDTLPVGVEIMIPDAPR